MKFIKKQWLKNNLFSKKFIFVLVILFFAVYSIAAILVPLHRYWQYESFYYDLGIFDQTIWRMSKLKIPIIDQYQGKSFFADHFVPSLYLVAPLFWFTEKTEFLLIAQSLSVILSMFLAYKIAKKELKNYLAVFALVVAYGGYIGLQNALIVDFHSITVSLLAIMLLFWSIYREKWSLYWLMLFLVLGFKENMATFILGVGIFLLFKQRKNRKIGIRTILLSLIYALLVVKFIIPFFNNGGYSYQPKIPTSPLKLIQSLFWPQIKLKTLFFSFSTFAFLPLLYLPLLPAYFLHFLERFVFNLSGTRWDLGLHYNAVLSPLMFISSLEIMKKLEKIKKHKIFSFFLSLLIVFLVCFYHEFLLHGPFGLAYNWEFYRHSKRQGFMNDFINQIPKDGLLMTQNNIAPRFTHSRVILLKDEENYSKLKPDYIALDLRGGQNGNNFFPLTEQKTRDLVKALLKDDNYSLQTQYGSFYIFAKKKS